MEGLLAPPPRHLLKKVDENFFAAFIIDRRGEELSPEKRAAEKKGSPRGRAGRVCGLRGYTL